MNRVYYTLFIYIRELNLNLNLFVRTWTLGLLYIIYIYKGTKLKPKLVDDLDGLISLLTEMKSE